MLLQKKVAIVTGASTGIGKAIAIKFAEEGASVVVVSRSNLGKKTVEEILNKGGDAVFIQCDVTSSKQVDDMVRDVINKFGKVDVLVNNAGGVKVAKNPAVSITDVTEEDWDAIINLNLKSVFLCCKAVTPHMKERKYGKIINVSSLGAICPGGPGATAYHAAKAGVIGLTLDLAFELAPYNINVNSILPGPVVTEFWGPLKDNEKFFDELVKISIPMQRAGKPEEVAGAALFLASDLSSYITGAVLPVAGGDPLKVWSVITPVYFRYGFPRKTE
jgi:NAD(P)-dependent dehydrogenase (short-subunit alcohol dehydrogenase family)